MIKKFLRKWRNMVEDPYFRFRELSQYQEGVLQGSKMVIEDLKKVVKREENKKNRITD